MKKALKILGIILGTITLVIFILVMIGYIHIGTAEFEKGHQVKIINNSTYETLNYFIEDKDIGNYKGKTIFFNSWATWCGPCKKEIPFLNNLTKKYINDTNVIFLSYCSDVKVNQIDSILKEGKLPNLIMTKISSKSGLRMSLRKIAVEQNSKLKIDTTNDAVPMNIIIDKSGKIVFHAFSLSEKDTSEIYEKISASSGVVNRR